MSRRRVKSKRSRRQRSLKTKSRAKSRTKNRHRVKRTRRKSNSKTSYKSKVKSNILLPILPKDDNVYVNVRYNNEFVNANSQLFNYYFNKECFDTDFDFLILTVKIVLFM